MSYIKKKRKVSVAMAIYNCAPTLREALDSILAQTYTDWELILCDDGSTDETSAIATEYSMKYDNILLLENVHNQGLPATLNTCIKYAQGDYIARMDGDDISLPDRFEKEVKFLDEHPEYALVSCAMINFDENGDWGVQRKPERPTVMDFVNDSPFCHAPCMMRKAALADVGNYTVRKELRRGQDYFLWHKFYAKGYKGYNFQEPYYKMRDDKDAALRRGFNVGYMQRINKALDSSKIKREIYRDLKIPYRYWIYSLRPVLIAMLPYRLYAWLHKRNINHG